MDGREATQGMEKDQDSGWHQRPKHIRRDEEESGESRRVVGRVMRNLPLAVYLDRLTWSLPHGHVSSVKFDIKFVIWRPCLQSETSTTVWWLCVAGLRGVSCLNVYHISATDWSRLLCRIELGQGIQTNVTIVDTDTEVDYWYLLVITQLSLWTVTLAY